MDQIEHKFIDIGGLKLHVAEIGTGPSVVLFLHGFPEIWYSWRHQMIAVAIAGFRAVAPDYRGYGLSDQPSEPEKTTFSDIVSDLVAILDFLGITKKVRDNYAQVSGTNLQEDKKLASESFPFCSGAIP